jgi:hypothetical protein
MIMKANGGLRYNAGELTVGDPSRNDPIAVSDTVDGHDPTDDQTGG